MGKNANQVILPLCLKPDRFLGGHVQAPHMVWVGCGALRIAGDRARGVKPTLLQAETATGAGSTAARRHLWCERAEGICKNLVRTVIQPWLSPWHMGRWDIASIALVEESISGCWLCTYRQLPQSACPMPFGSLASSCLRNLPSWLSNAGRYLKSMCLESCAHTCEQRSMF